MSWLDNALDYGINEKEFWDMTLAEIIRRIESQKRVKQIQEKEKAAYDYILADLIGRSISRIYSSAATMPTISEAYPALFDNNETQEAVEQRNIELSVLRFKQYANFHNKKYEGDSEK